MGHYVRDFLEKKTSIVAATVNDEGKQEEEKIFIQINEHEFRNGTKQAIETKIYNAFMFAINTTINAIAQILNPSWIFIDNQSTVDLFCNADLLIEMHEVDEGFIIHCNI